MIMPFIHQYKQSDEIIFVGRSPAIDIIKPYIGLSIDYEISGLHNLYIEKPSTRFYHFLPKFELIIAFLSNPHGLVQSNLKTIFKNIPSYLFPPFPKESEMIHVAQYLYNCFKKAGLSIEVNNIVDMAFKKPILKKSLRPSERNDRIIFHPGSGGEKKNYSAEFWIELIKIVNKISDNRDLTLLLGPAEAHLHAIFKTVLRDINIEIINSPTIEKLISIFRQSRYFIGHDSGVTHLAAMLGVSVTALFKNSSPKQWGPLGPFVTIIMEKEESQDLIHKTINSLGVF